MSSVLTNDIAESFWTYCPSDILILIFKRLDVKSLINCMRVTKSWSDTVHYYCQHYNLWGKMLEVSINKKGMITYEEKSNLNEQDLFLSASHWLNIQDPKILLHNTYKVEKNRNICVFKGTLIVTSHIAYNFIDVKKKKMIKRCEKKCLNYVETSSLIAELTLPNLIGYNILTLTNKLHYNVCECTAVKKIILFDISIFKNQYHNMWQQVDQEMGYFSYNMTDFNGCSSAIKWVQLNACYIIDIKNVLWVYIAKECNWDCKALARYYGNKDSVSTIHIHDDDVYMLLKTGDILKVDLKCKKFERLLHLRIPLYYFDRAAFMFHKYSVIVEVPNDKAYDIYPQKESKQTVIACPGLTCSLEHGPVLITGYENGKIEIFLIENLVNDEPTIASAFHFYLQSYVNLHSFKIISINVYEDTDGHHLFVATENNIYEFLITY